MTDTIDAITGAIQNFIVAPLSAFGVGGFIFDVQGESIASLSADITDHYTEDNRALQDHIAIKPKKITLKGYVGELLYSAPGAGRPALGKVPQKLAKLQAYLPILSSAAHQLQDAIAPASATGLTLSTAANIYGVVKNTLGAVGGQSKQQNAYAYFQALQSEGILMGIQTPWEFISNMAIETITAIQDESTKYITDFSVTFKQIRIAATQTFAYSAGNTGGILPPGGIQFQGDAAMQCTEQNPLGIVPGLFPYTGSGDQARMTGAHSLQSIGGLESLFSFR